MFMTFLALDQIQRTVVQLILKLSKNAGIDDLLDLDVRNRGTTFFVRTFDVSLGFDINLSNEVSEAKVANRMEAFIQVCEFLYFVDAGWFFAARIDAFYLLVLVVWLFVGEDAVILEVIKL